MLKKSVDFQNIEINPKIFQFFSVLSATNQLQTTNYLDYNKVYMQIRSKY